MIWLPPTVHWIELLSAVISGLGAGFLAWVARDAWRDWRAVPSQRPELRPLARFAVASAVGKGLAQTIFLAISVRAMVLPTATAQRDGTPDLGAILSIAGLIAIELLLTALGIQNVIMRREVRQRARAPYVGPERRKSNVEA